MIGNFAQENRGKGAIFFGWLNPWMPLFFRKDKFGVEIRERAKWDIREAMVGTETFDPKHIIIATWKNVSFAGGIPIAARRVSDLKNVFLACLAKKHFFLFALCNLT